MEKMSKRKSLGRTGIQVPQVIYGTSYLGNLYRVLPYEDKLELIKGWFACTEKPVVIDTAGKYGAGLALEIIGKGLADLEIDPEDILISNKLGWYRIPLRTDEPTFEPGAWSGLEYDCMQRFGYNEIRECFEQGLHLLGGTYSSELVSVHDPDEYLHASDSPEEREKRLWEIRESYRALFDLKAEGRVKAVGIGSKDWTIIRELYGHVPFDWVMLANSYTILSHPKKLIEFMYQLDGAGVGIINSAVFHGGFLTGGAKFDYRDVDPDSAEGRFIYSWRERFRAICIKHKVDPGDACLHFGLSHPGIASIALNTSKPEKMHRNVSILERAIPPEFWKEMKKVKLIHSFVNYL